MNRDRISGRAGGTSPAEGSTPSASTNNPRFNRDFETPDEATSSPRTARLARLREWSNKHRMLRDHGSIPSDLGILLDEAEAASPAARPGTNRGTANPDEFPPYRPPAASGDALDAALQAIVQHATDSGMSFDDLRTLARLIEVVEAAASPAATCSCRGQKYDFHRSDCVQAASSGDRTAADQPERHSWTDGEWDAYSAGYIEGMAAEAEAASPAASGDALREAWIAHRVATKHGQEGHPECGPERCAKAIANRLATSPPLEAGGLDLDAIWDHVRVEHGCTHDIFRPSDEASPPVPEGLDVERLIDILDSAEGDGIIGPDYTPRLLAEYILAASPPLPEGPDVARLNRYYEHVGDLNCPEWHTETCEFQVRCDEPGCKRETTCGFPTESGYRQTCSEHYQR